MEILKFLTDNFAEFNTIQEQHPACFQIHPRIQQELDRLRVYLQQFDDFLQQERFCIYETYGTDEYEEDKNYIEINYLYQHRLGYLTDSYETDEENNLFNNMPAIAEETESTFGRSMLYTYPDREHITFYEDNSISMDNDYYDPSNEEEVYLIQEAVKILCEYPAFQVLQSPYGDRY